MKKQILAVVLLFSFSIAVEAQDLLYQWAFTNSSDTATSSIPTYAFTPGTGNLGLLNVSGDAITPGLIFFSTNNANYGPPGGSGGALVLNGQTYSGSPSAVATNSSLNLGTLPQFTITFWVQYGASVASGTQLARQVQFGAAANYDSGGKGGGNHNGVGTALNGAASPAAGSYSQFQDGIANAASGSNPQVTITANPNFPNGFVCDGTTWYFEAMTYDGTLTANNFTIWLASTNASTLAGTPGVIPFVGSQNLGGINFTTNGSVILAGCTQDGPRGMSTGKIADVRIYTGIWSSNNLELIRNYQTPIPPPPVTNAASITIQPSSGSTFESGNRIFSVVATGVPATVFSYTWTSNGVVIASSTNASYTSSITISHVTAAANGASFVCWVTNTAGGTNSAPAILTVVPSTPGSYAHAVFTNKPFAFWLVNEPSNSTPIVISDYANGNDGVALNPVGDLFQSGPTNTLYVGFPTNATAIETPPPGRAGRLNMPVLPNYPNTGMTICGWVYTPTAGNAAVGNNGLIYTLPSDTANGFGLIFGANNELDYQWGGANNTGSGLIIPSGQWTFVAMVISTNLSTQDLAGSITADTNATLYVGSKSAGLTSYVDGTAFTGHTIPNGSSAAVLALGRTTVSFSENGGYTAQSNVRFNDVAVFYKALSSDDINNLYVAGAGVPVVNTWVGNHSSDWDTATLNWTSGGVPALYSDGNVVLFNDTANTGNVNLAGNFSPGSVTVSNNALAYVIGGGSIGGFATLTKQGANVLTLNGDHTYTGITTVGSGTLLVESSISSGVNITGGTLGGNFGTINGTVTARSGGTLAPGATLSTAGTFLTVGGLTLLPGSTTIMQVKHSGATLNGDQILNSGLNNISYGGTLIISTNAGDATTYKVGDKVVLFSNGGSGGFTNSFASIQPAPGLGLAWSNDAVNLGQFIVIVAPPVTAPVAGFSGVPTNIFVTQTVVFTNTSTGSYTNSAWTFGDGNVTNTAGANAANNVSNTYNNTGSDTVTLIVTGAGGSSTNTQAAYIAVKPKLTIGQPVPSSGNLILSGTNGPIGQQYRILSTTNVALNVANWTPVFTNVFTPPNGSYNFTNTAQTNNASFFRLVSP